MIRFRGNTKHTQKNGFEPGEITVEWTGEEGDYQRGTIHDWTLRIHDELEKACQKINAGQAGGDAPRTPRNPFTSIHPQ